MDLYTINNTAGLTFTNIATQETYCDINRCPTPPPIPPTTIYSFGNKFILTLNLLLSLSFFTYFSGKKLEEEEEEKVSTVPSKILKKGVNCNMSPSCRRGSIKGQVFSTFFCGLKLIAVKIGRLLLCRRSSEPESGWISRSTSFVYYMIYESI